MTEVDHQPLPEEAIAYCRVQHVDPLLFRAYDIRGEADGALTVDVVYTIAQAIAVEVLAQREHTVVVARDGRLSGPALSAALIAGLRTMGVDVVDLGMVPTPVLYYATHHLGTRSGVMLTGSHNPANYNGLKMVVGGRTLSGDDIQQLYARIRDADWPEALAEAARGAYTANHAIPDQYLQEIVQSCVLQRPIRVVLDCGNGVTGVLAETLYKALGAEVVMLHDTVDGRFPNHHPDPTRPENLTDLINTVAAVKADVGLAFDGDGDRLGVVSPSGEMIWADRQMILFARDVLSRHPGGTVIYDVKCTQHLAAAIRAAGGVPLMCQTGHSLVKAQLAETDALLAGEMSGHLFFKENWYGFDDGLYAGVRLLALLSSSTQPCEAIFQALPDSVNTPELHLPMADEHKAAFMKTLAAQADFGEAEVITIDGLRVQMPHAWGLVRASNTTPCLVLRFEADDEAALAEIQAQFRTQLLAIDPDLALPF